MLKQGYFGHISRIRASKDIRNRPKCVHSWPCPVQRHMDCAGARCSRVGRNPLSGVDYLLAPERDRTRITRRYVAGVSPVHLWNALTKLDDVLYSRRAATSWIESRDERSRSIALLRRSWST